MQVKDSGRLGGLQDKALNLQASLYRQMDTKGINITGLCTDRGATHMDQVLGQRPNSIMMIKNCKIRSAKEGEDPINTQ